VRYLGEAFVIAALCRGRSIEQFLGHTGDSGTPRIRRVEFVPVGEDCRVVLHESRDVGGEHFCDLAAQPEGSARVYPLGARAFRVPAAAGVELGIPGTSRHTSATLDPDSRQRRYRLL
jgi:hypothetical protein